MLDKEPKKLPHLYLILVKFYDINKERSRCLSLVAVLNIQHTDRL